MTLTSSPYLVRPMTVEDIPRVSEIERGSFPTMWPQTAYKRELQRNKLAAYLVACEGPDPVLAASTADRPPSDEAKSAGTNETRPESGLRRLFRRVIGTRSEPPAEVVIAGGEGIVGFVGMWFMVDEAHIVTIAVDEDRRRRGLGEMLLIAAIELAQRRNQEVLTLECRASNLAAQALYEKYGFRKVGVRKRYYTDNNEDALIMTTFPIRGDEFKGGFEQLRAAWAARRGAPRLEFPELPGTD